jgi:putative flippase GtrA
MSIGDLCHFAGCRAKRAWGGFKARVASAFDSKLTTVIGPGRNNLLIRFVAVGFVNTAFGYVLFAALYTAFQSHRAAIVLATAGGIIFNFFTTGRVVFGDGGLSRLVPFVLGYGFVMAVDIVLVDLGAAIGFSPFLGQAFALPVMVALAFLINDRLVFRRAG